MKRREAQTFLGSLALRDPTTLDLSASASSAGAFRSDAECAVGSSHPGCCAVGCCFGAASHHLAEDVVAARASTSQLAEGAKAMKVSGLGSTLEELARRRRKWKTSLDQSAPERIWPPLIESPGFGPNPGKLRMFSHIPSGLAQGSPLVVLLHGCTQTAASYAAGTGWTTLADRYGFALLLPEQRRSNNPNACFNWFQSPHVTRDSGEVLSIRCMVGRLVDDHGLDPCRVFISGLSAGGAMTAAMLATYPEVFAGGAIIAGLPYGCASNVQEALQCMSKPSIRATSAWGDLVRAASVHAGPWPRISVWHGTADATVVPANGTEILKQWADVHGIQERPCFEDYQVSVPHRSWRNREGAVVLESYRIAGMSHGVPIAPNAPSVEQRCGVPGAFILDAGISSTYHIAQSWGLANRNEAAASEALVDSASGSSTWSEQPGEIRQGGTSRKLALDPASIIDRALQAAGLSGDKRSR